MPFALEGINPFLLANIALLVVALGLGGASRLNIVQASIVEVASLLMLPWAVFRLTRTDRVKAIMWPLLLMAGILLVPLLQLIPLPPGVWTSLPGGEETKRIYDVAGMSLPWRPLSVMPDLTIRSSLALSTPFAVFLGWATLSSRDQRIGLGVILGMVLLSLVLGALQIAGGGPGYLYEMTNNGSLVGFFANRNHQASLLLCALPITAALLASADRKALRRTALIVLCLGLTFTVIMALAAVRSRAGILLLGPALVASMLILITARRFGNPNRLVLILGGVLGCAVVLIAGLGLRPLMARFEANLGDDSRFTFAPDIWRSAVEHFPTGTGLGAFDSIYRSVERLEIVQSAFVNHAHNDYLELLLETGALGVVFLAGFLIWWVARSWTVWTKWTDDTFTFARAGSIVIGLLLVHSGFDYPLRTLALAAVFAFACSLLVKPQREPERLDLDDRAVDVRLRRRRIDPQPSSGVDPHVALRAGSRNGGRV